jgi:hypothetical protein
MDWPLDLWVSTGEATVCGAGAAGGWSTSTAQQESLSTDRARPRGGADEEKAERCRGRPLQLTHSAHSQSRRRGRRRSGALAVPATRRRRRGGSRPRRVGIGSFLGWAGRIADGWMDGLSGFLEKGRRETEAQAERGGKPSGENC